MIVTFDIDGVIAGGEYIPEWDRHPDTYRKLPLVEEGIQDKLHDLAKVVNIYLLSSRRFPKCLEITRLWLNENKFCMGDFTGILVGLHYNEKTSVARMLGSKYHLDDDFRVVGPLNGAGKLFVARSVGVERTYPWSREAVENGRPYIQDWDQVVEDVASLFRPL